MGCWQSEKKVGRAGALGADDEERREDAARLVARAATRRALGCFGRAARVRGRVLEARARTVSSRQDGSVLRAGDPTARSYDGRRAYASEAYRPTGDQAGRRSPRSPSRSSAATATRRCWAPPAPATATMAWIAEQAQKPTLVIAHNKTLAAQLCNEFGSFCPGERRRVLRLLLRLPKPALAYVPQADLYIEKGVHQRRHRPPPPRGDGRASPGVLIVASVSCIYGIGSPEAYEEKTVALGIGQEIDRDVMLRKLVDIQYAERLVPRPRALPREGDVVEVQPAHMESAYRVSFFGDEVEQITHFDPLGRDLRSARAPGDLPGDPVRDLPRDDRAVRRRDQARARGAGEGVRVAGEAARGAPIRQRTEYDLEMLQELGYCNGIENYSRILDGRAPGTPPHTPRLLRRRLRRARRRVAPDRAADRRHVRGRPLPQGDARRARLPAPVGPRQPPASVRRVRPRAAASLRLGDAGPFELRNSTNAEQIIRPTGVVDPEVELRPTKNQIDDLLNEIRTRRRRASGSSSRL